MIYPSTHYSALIEIHSTSLQETSQGTIHRELRWHLISSPAPHLCIALILAEIMFFISEHDPTGHIFTIRLALTLHKVLVDSLILYSFLTIV